MKLEMLIGDKSLEEIKKVVGLQKESIKSLLELAPDITLAKYLARAEQSNKPDSAYEMLGIMTLRLVLGQELVRRLEREI